MPVSWFATHTTAWMPQLTNVEDLITQVWYITQGLSFILSSDSKCLVRVDIASQRRHECLTRVTASRAKAFSRRILIGPME